MDDIEVLEIPCACGCESKASVDFWPVGTLNTWSGKSPAISIGVYDGGKWGNTIIQGEPLLDLGKKIVAMFDEKTEPAPFVYDVPVLDNPLIPDGYIAVVEDLPDGTKRMIGARLPNGTVMSFNQEFIGEESE
jgi:hypothetical protein